MVPFACQCARVASAVASGTVPPPQRWNAGASASYNRHDHINPLKSNGTTACAQRR